MFGGAFASGFGGAGGKLSSFAASSSNADAKKDAKQPVFGAPVDENADDDGEESGDGGESGAEVATEADTDTNSKSAMLEGSSCINQDMAQTFACLPPAGNTGEEEEVPLFNSRGKLFQFNKEKNAWAERGVGPIKLNLKRQYGYDEDDLPDTDSPDSDEDGEEHNDKPKKSEKPKKESKLKKPEARYLMRAAATHKVILNSPVFKTMNVGDPKGNPPVGRQLYFQAHIDGKVTNCLLRVRFLSLHLLPSISC